MFPRLAVLGMVLAAGCSCQFKWARNYNLAGVWIKHDRAVHEVFRINITQTSCPLPSNPYPVPSSPSPTCLPSYSGYYLSGPLTGKLTFNTTSVGDLMSSTGTYANFADDSGKVACPAPFAMILEDDTNVALISYGSTFGTACGDYVGDSARYYRESLLFN